MAMYHLHAKIHGRSAGKSAVMCAAYRSASRIVDERTGEIANYTRKKGVIECGIEAPEGAAAWMKDRATLWNAVEKAEVRKDAQLAREFEITVPHELDRAAQKALILGFVRQELVGRGMVADWAWHEPNAKGDRRNGHVHIMTATRAAESEGFGKKARQWNDTATLVQIRKAWTRHANQALERAGRAERIDDRTLAAQGIDREPTLKKGVRLTNMERREATKQAAAKGLAYKQAARAQQRPASVPSPEYVRATWDVTLLESVARAAADPTALAAAKANAAAYRAQVLKAEVIAGQPAWEKAVAAAAKEAQAAGRRHAAWEKAHPFPMDVPRKLLERKEDWNARGLAARADWNQTDRELALAASEAERRRDQVADPKTALAAATRRIAEAPEYDNLRFGEAAIDQLEADRRRERDRGRDLGRGVER